jgi:chemotaxis protein methyltransferase CheR
LFATPHRQADVAARGLLFSGPFPGILPEAAKAGLYFEGRASQPPTPAKRSLVAQAVCSRPAPAIPRETSAFFQWLLGRAGLESDRYRETSLVRRLPACLRRLRVKNISEAYELILRRPELLPEVIDVVLLGVTEFCRDGAVFASLRDKILPSILQRTPRPRIWSAACSGGHELYSVAFMLADSSCLADCELLGTDCRASAIQHAISGCYSPESLATVDRAWGQLHFENESGTFRVRRSIRESLRWKTADLLAGVEPGPWHLTLCRNMAIYLRQDAAANLWRHILSEMAPDGYLVVGKADHPPRGLPIERIDACIYRRIEDPS